MVMLGFLHFIVNLIDQHGTFSPIIICFILSSIAISILGILTWFISLLSTPFAIVIFGFGSYMTLGVIVKASGILSPQLIIKPQEEGTIRFIFISDTHGKHDMLKLPPGDVLIHAGDFTRRGTLKEITSFNTWLGTLPYRRKIVVAGNHELAIDNETYPLIWKKWHETYQNPTKAREILTNCDYLENSATEVDGIRIYGSPYTIPIKGRTMAFNVERGKCAAAIWNSIPSDTQILVTHGPPFGILDKVIHDNSHVGDEDLLKQVLTRIKPLVHVFGHIHESYGKTIMGTTTFLNAAVCTLLRQPRNPPWILDIPSNNK